jgi:predicted nuclease with TOPRIM domain
MTCREQGEAFKNTLNNLRKKYDNIVNERENLKKDLKVTQDNFEYTTDENEKLRQEVENLSVANTELNNSIHLLKLGRLRHNFQ